MTCDTEQSVPLSVALQYARKAFDKGKISGEAAVLHGLKSVAACNGSGERVVELIRKGGDPAKNAWVSAKIKKLVGEGKSQEAAVGEAEGMWRGRKKKRLKAFILAAIRKAAGYVESEHPRGHDGRYISKGDIDEARGNPQKEADLRARVRPEDKDILEEHLANPGHTADARAFHPSAQHAGHLRGIGEEHGEHVAAWLTAATAAIRHGADYDHSEIQRATERAVAGQVGKLRRVLRALDPDTKVSSQPAHKEGVQKRIREIISTAIHAAKDIRQHAVRAEKEEREKELQQHAAAHALKLRDAVGHLSRMEGWRKDSPHDPQPGDAVHEARELIARLLGHEEGAAVKAFKEDEPVPTDLAPAPPSDKPRPAA